MDAAALVVGIDDYAVLPGLSGCTTDALETVDWLLSIGVKAERIRLHLATSSAVVVPAGVVRRTADRDAIWKSIVGLRGESGERLFVFLSGHGYFILETGPIFLAQDWSSDGNKNLDVWAFAKHFQGLKFKDTLFVVDACQNKDTDDIYRSTIVPAGPSDAKILPDPANGVLLCCAASQGQYAPVIDGRGLLTRKLLTVLRDAPTRIPGEAREAYVYDWKTGAAQLDLLPLFSYVVSPAVTENARPHNQLPTKAVYGRLGNESRFTVHDLPPIKTAALRVVAEPPEGLDSISLQLRPATKDRLLPAVDAELPFTGFAPIGRRLIANCIPADGWEADNRTRDIASVSADVDLRFTLSQPPPPPGQEAFNITVIGGDGDSTPDLDHDDYRAVGVDPDADFKAAFPPGAPRIQHHETGPDVFLNGGGFDAAREVATRLRNGLSERLLSRGIRRQMTITPPGRDRDSSLPNLRLSLPEGGPTGLAGYLGAEPLIRIERLGHEGEEPVKRLTADRQAQYPWLRLDPGSYRVVIDAPWGAASVIVDLEAEGRQTVELPTPVGQPPLRNRIANQAGPPASGLLAGSALDGGPWVSLDDAVADDRLVAPALPGLSLLVDRQDGLVRVEPYSDLPWMEWDLLIGAGRLDAVDLDAAVARLAEGRDGADIEVLRLALGYAAWAQRRPDLIGTILDSLSFALQRSTDAVLLRLEAESDVTPERLSPPVFRWGTQLIQRRAPETKLSAWPSLTSVWSVYEAAVVDTEPDPVTVRRVAAAG